MAEDPIQRSVNEHYGRSSLLEAIQDALQSAGKDPFAPSTEELAWRPCPQGTPAALPYYILRRLSSTSESCAAPRST